MLVALEGETFSYPARSRMKGEEIKEKFRLRGAHGVSRRDLVGSTRRADGEITYKTIAPAERLNDPGAPERGVALSYYFGNGGATATSTST